MPVPRREIHAEFQAILTRRASNLAHHVSFALFPRASFDAIVCLPGRPETEPVVMFRYQQDVLRPACLDSLHPLVRIKLRWVKHRRAGRPIAPLAIEEGVGREMNNDSELQ